MNNYHKIKESCRQGLLPYLDKACCRLPRMETARILDIGCGSGVPTVWLAENFPGNITAVDNDADALRFLERKAVKKNLSHRINTVCSSFNDFESAPEFYDIILAEGFLNVVGFESGFLKIIRMLKVQGYFIIHDEYKDHGKKVEFITKNNCTLADTLHLDDAVWWKGYYRQLEMEINKLNDSDKRSLFHNDIEEIKLFKARPDLFQSVYYVIRKD